MTDFKRIYTEQAEAYEAMVAREDWQGNLLKALQAIRSLTNLTVVELGAGTGRITRLLAPHVHQIFALDIALPMLRVAREKSGASANLINADNRQLPIADETADLTIAGWSLGHFVGWYSDDWQTQIGQAIAEMKRVLRPGGTLIIIETLGTGHKTPTPPHEGLAAYYRWLENELGFTRAWIRTDYRFASVEEAAVLTRFFFGDELADMIRSQELTILPECTGIWYWHGR